jgi:hypothetical protein
MIINYSHALWQCGNASSVGVAAAIASIHVVV